MTNLSEMMRPLRAVTLKSLLSESNTRNCLLLAAIPIALSIVNSSWLYSRVGFLDPWVNVGYFLHYSDPTFGNTYYKIARLSWIIPGFVAYQLFQPVVANYLLHISCLILCVVFFYLVVSMLFGQRIALAIAACMAVFVPLHASGGGLDYQNAPAATYYIISFYLLTSTFYRGNPRARLIGAGAAYAAALHSTIGFVNVAPILAFHWAVLYRHKQGQLPSWRFVLTSALWFLCGGVAITLLLGLVNVAVGRDFFFFKLLLNLVVNFVGDSRNQASWWISLSASWLGDVNYMRYLGLGAATLVGCVACAFVAIFRTPRNPIALSLQLQYIFIVAIWIVWHALGQTALQPEYFVYPIYPAMFFALAAITASGSRPEDLRPANFSFYLVLAVIAVTPLIYSIGDRLVRWPQHSALMLGLSLICVGLLSISRQRLIFILAGVLAFAGMNAFGAVISVGRDYAMTEPCKDRAGAFSALLDSDRFLDRFVGEPNEMYLWWSQGEVLHDNAGCELPVFAIAETLVSLGLFSYLAAPWEGMPQADALSPASISMITGKRKIAVLTADYSTVKSLMLRFRRAGVNVAVQGQAIERTSRFSFRVYVIGPSVSRESQRS